MWKSTPNITTNAEPVSIRSALGRLAPAPWEIVVGASLIAGIGSGWTALLRRAVTPSPFLAALTMMLVTFAGWYAWAFFTHLIGNALFGRHSDYQGMLNTFATAYAFQALCLLSFTYPLGWVWTWIAAYLTIVAWGVLAPRRLGMRTWQAIVAAALGMLVWLACLVGLMLTVTWDGLYIGIGAFLA